MEFGCPFTLETPAGNIAFNDFASASYYRLTKFDVLSPLRKSVDNVAALDGAIVGPGLRGGAFPMLEGQIKVDDVATRSTMLDKIRAWPASLESVEGILRWTPSGKTERRMLVTLMEDVQTRGEVMKEFRVALVAEDSRIYENTVNAVDSSVLVAGIGGTWSIPIQPAQPRWLFPINFGSASTGGTATISNNGELATPPVLRIYGAITSPAVLNLTTGALISFPGLSIVEGDYVEVDMAKRTALLNADPLDTVTGNLDFAQSTYWLLGRGTNSLRLAGANPGASTHVSVLWMSAFR